MLQGTHPPPIHPSPQASLPLFSFCFSASRGKTKQHFFHTFPYYAKLLLVVSLFFVVEERAVYQRSASEPRIFKETLNKTGKVCINVTMRRVLATIVAVQNNKYYIFWCWPGSSVGIATDYGLNGPGSNPGGDEIFRASRPALGPTQLPVQWVPGLSRR